MKQTVSHHKLLKMTHRALRSQLVLLGVNLKQNEMSQVNVSLMSWGLDDSPAAPQQREGNCSRITPAGKQGCSAGGQQPLHKATTHL